MSFLRQIAFYQNRRDEVPNQQLARKLSSANSKAGVREMAKNLGNRNSSVRSDCLKVLYEVGYLKPQLIAPYVADFLKLLDDKNNRMVWGAMIALASIAAIKHDEIWSEVDKLTAAIDNGTLITQVWGIRALARSAAKEPGRSKRIRHKLECYLRSSKARDVPTHLESMLPVMDKSTWRALQGIVQTRQREMTASHQARLRKVLKQIPGSDRG